MLWKAEHPESTLVEEMTRKIFTEVTKEPKTH